MIRVLKNYGGVLTGEQRIEPGDYESGDKRLFGIEAHLIEEGVAIVVGDDAPAFVPPDDEPDLMVIESPIELDETNRPVSKALKNRQ